MPKGHGKSKGGEMMTAEALEQYLDAKTAEKRAKVSREQVDTPRPEKQQTKQQQQQQPPPPRAGGMNASPFTSKTPRRQRRCYKLQVHLLLCVLFYRV